MARKDVNQTAFLIVGHATGEIGKPVKKNGHRIEGVVKATKKQRIKVSKKR